MFIAVTKEIFGWFSEGKVYELRASRVRFTENTLGYGKVVTISEGYSGRRFKARIVGTVFAPTIDRMFDIVPFKKINPRAATKAEAIRMARETCGKGGLFVAIRLKKVRKSRKGSG